jgi:hypothetical protein
MSVLNVRAAVDAVVLTFNGLSEKRQRYSGCRNGRMVGIRLWLCLSRSVTTTKRHGSKERGRPKGPLDGASVDMNLVMADSPAL